MANSESIEDHGEPPLGGEEGVRKQRAARGVIRRFSLLTGEVRVGDASKIRAIGFEEAGKRLAASIPDLRLPKAAQPGQESVGDAMVAGEGAEVVEIHATELGAAIQAETEMGGPEAQAASI